MSVPPRHTCIRNGEIICPDDLCRSTSRTLCHTITELHRRRCWTLVIKGPRRRKWGFYMPGGYLDERAYDETVRADRRDLWSDQRQESRPW